MWMRTSDTSGILGADVVFDPVRNFVSVGDGHLRIDFDVHIDEVLVTGFTDEALLDRVNTFDFSGRFFDFVTMPRLAAVSINSFTAGRRKRKPLISDNAGSDDGGGIIRFCESRSTD